MNTGIRSGLTLALAAAPLGCAALECSVQTRDGVPTLMLNGQPAPPFIFLHTAGGGAAGPLTCEVTPEWQEFHYSFTAPTDDDRVGVHINNVAPVGDWFVDDARFFEGTLDKPLSENMLVGGDFEGGELPKAWSYFLSPVAGAEAAFALESSGAHGGASCLRVRIVKPGAESWHIHAFQVVKVQKARTYTFAAWLRASDRRQIDIKAVHQGDPWTIYGGTPGASDRLLALGAERSLHIGTPPMNLPWPKDGKAPDFSGVDAQMDHILSVAPRSLTIPRIHLDAPDWWKTENPGHRQVYDKGEYPMASPASKLWRRDAAAALRLLLRHLETKYGENIPGYHVTAQSAGEWFYDHTWEKIMPCFEEPFRQAFAEWVRAKYGTVEKLREAWRQPDVTFEAIRVPTLEERTTGKLGVFRDPQAQRFAIDFAEYMQVCLCEYLEECARIVKEETGGRKLSVFFYGYLYDVAGFAYGGAVSGHLRLRRALNSPHIDVVCSPITYGDRESGSPGSFMAPVDSIQAHGKLWINEDDTRTHLAPKDANFGRTDNMFQTLGVYRRNFGHQFERRCGTWYMDFGTGWMADPEIFDNFAKVRDIWSAAPAPRAFAPQVAIIIDEDSFLYLRNSNEITAPAINWVRRQFNTMGCPVGLYLMEDLCEGRVPESVRMYLFLNAFRVTAEQRRLLRERIARDNRTAVWLYAPGYISENALAANIADLIGMSVVETDVPKTSRIRLAGDLAAPLQALPREHTFGVEFRPKPMFAVTPGQSGVTALGVYEGTDRIALAELRTAQGRSVFCGGLAVSAEVLRELAREAGAHVYCETNDVVSACPGFVSIHATHTGTKKLTFPGPVQVSDLVAGQVVATGVTEYVFQMEKGDTRLFGLQ